jgi:hypothetical protein
MNPEFASIFARLREILRKHSAAFTVTTDAPDHYSLYLDFSPKFQKGFPVAWVRISKAYVSYHFMPVYGHPTLLDSKSDKLKRRKQGKSCFNFKVMDEPLFKELEELANEGFAAFRKAGITL